MKNIIIYLICYSPVVIYNIVVLYTKKPNSGIDSLQIIISAILAVFGYTMCQRLLKKE